MSKRPRDEASVASIRAVLGDISIEAIDNLLHRSNNNVEMALNLYFTTPLPKPPQPKKTLLTFGSKKKETQQQVKYFIGDLVITGTY